MEQDLVPYPVPSKDGSIMVRNGQKLNGRVNYRLVTAAGATTAHGYQIIDFNTNILKFEFGQNMAADGLYFLHLENNNRRYILRLIKLR